MIHALSHPTQDPDATFTNRRYMLSCPWCLGEHAPDFDLEAEIRRRNRAYQGAQTLARHKKIHDLGSASTYSRWWYHELPNHDAEDCAECRRAEDEDRAFAKPLTPYQKLIPRA